VVAARGDGRYLVAWLDDVPVGWVFVHRPGSPEASARARTLGVAEVQDLQVADGFRGRGFGRALLEAAEDAAEDAGWIAIGLEVTVANPHNDVARAMYERHGFRDAGVGTFESGYHYWTDAGERRWDGEPHRYLVKVLRERSQPT
jgi:GNAT superfamily N-acetyltransferase